MTYGLASRDLMEDCIVSQIQKHIVNPKGTVEYLREVSVVGMIPHRLLNFLALARLSSGGSLSFLIFSV